MCCLCVGLLCTGPLNGNYTFKMSVNYSHLVITVAWGQKKKKKLQFSCQNKFGCLVAISIVASLPVFSKFGPEFMNSLVVFTCECLCARQPPFIAITCYFEGAMTLKM